MHNVIILERIRVRLTGSLIEHEMFALEGINEKIEATLEKVDRERAIIRQIKDQLILHSDIAKHVDSMSEAEAQFAKAVAGQSPDDERKFEVIKRMFWNEYTKAQHRLTLFTEDQPQLVQTLSKYLQEKFTNFNTTLTS